LIKSRSNEHNNAQRRGGADNGKPLIIWGDLSEPDLKFIKARLDPRALVVLPAVESAGQAEGVWKLLKA
jgi:hypothetical protein